MWLLVLLALLVGAKRKYGNDQSRERNGKYDEVPPNYSALNVFAATKFLISLIYLILEDRISLFGLSPNAVKLTYTFLFWSLYFASTVCVFFVMAALLKRSLQPLPGFSSAALILFRWASIIALLIALTAHIPVFGVGNWRVMMDEVDISFLLCVCAFEISLLVLLIGQIQQLGMCLMSRPVGIAFGLAVLGVADLISALTISMPPRIVNIVNFSGECAAFFISTLWIFYIWRPEPKRLPTSLSQASRLMKWNEIALKLEINGKQPEHVPFIAGVEATVDAILEKFKERAS